MAPERIAFSNLFYYLMNYGEKRGGGEERQMKREMELFCWYSCPVRLNGLKGI